METRNFRVCPECANRTSIRGISLSTEEIDLLAILVQCRVDPSHIYAFYYRLEKVKPKWDEFLRVEAERSEGA